LANIIVLLPFTRHFRFADDILYMRIKEGRTRALIRRGVYRTMIAQPCLRLLIAHVFDTRFGDLQSFLEYTASSSVMDQIPTNSDQATILHFTAVMRSDKIMLCLNLDSRSVAFNRIQPLVISSPVIQTLVRQPLWDLVFAMGPSECLRG